MLGILNSSNLATRILAPSTFLVPAHEPPTWWIDWYITRTKKMTAKPIPVTSSPCLYSVSQTTGSLLTLPTDISGNRRLVRSEQVGIFRNEYLALWDVLLFLGSFKHLAFYSRNHAFFDYMAQNLKNNLITLLLVARMYHFCSGPTGCCLTVRRPQTLRPDVLRPR